MQEVSIVTIINQQEMLSHAIDGANGIYKDGEFLVNMDVNIYLMYLRQEAALGLQIIESMKQLEPDDSERDKLERIYRRQLECGSIIFGESNSRKTTPFKVAGLS